MNQRQLFLQHVAQTSDFPLSLEIEKAEGIYLFDKNGKKYMDLISGISVSNLGHRHSRVIEAVKSQLEKYTHLMVYGEYVQSPQVKLATKIADLLPDTLESCYFVNSGSEAVEGAMKLAKRYTGRPNIFAFKNAYHGSSQGALSIAGDENLKSAFRPLLPGTKLFDFNSEEILYEINQDTAAVFIELVQGEAGIIKAEKEFVQKLSAKCKSTGALLVVDEIQTGFGRTGKLFAFGYYDIVPDIITLAKGMGGGFPLGVFISSNEIMSVLKNNPVLGHITTFGGHPVSCAASLETLNILTEENDLIKSVPEKEKLFLELLSHPKIKSKRSVGLMIAIEFESYEQNKAIIDAGIENGVILDWFLFNDKSMRIAPPLTISEEEIRKACKIIMKIIEEI